LKRPDATHISGFTLIEIMIAIILFLGTFLAFNRIIAGIAVKGADQEKMADAMNLASGILEKAMTASFSDLEARGNSWTQTEDGCRTTGQRKVMTGSSGRDDIPYFLLEVVCPYQGTAPGHIAVSGVIPYPHIRVVSVTLPPGTTATASTSTEEVVSLDVNVEVRSTLLIFYNIAMVSQGAEPTDLLFTSAFVNGSSRGLTTGTPIMTQPSINNVVTAPVAKGSHRIDVRWRKEKPTGTVELRKATMNVLIVEANS